MAAEAQQCVKATLEYDGTAFAGSQVQPNARTVQGELEEALNRLIGAPTRVRLAGRTDAGVHATGQVAAFRVPGALPRGGGLPELQRRLNAALPPDLAVRSLRRVADDFDPRRDALRRVYRYRVRANAGKRPLDRNRTLEIDDRLDVVAMQAAAARMLGERDFAALGSHARGRTVRRVTEVDVRRRGDLVEVRVTADAFLRRMVRSLVAVLLEVGRGRMDPEGVDALLDPKRRALHGRAAPPRGLTLERIVYRPISQPKNDKAATSRRRRLDRRDKSGEQGT